VASKYIKKHLAWQKYAKKEMAAGRKPVKFKDWKPKSEKETTRTKSVSSQLKRSGLTDKEINRLRRSE